MLVRPQVCAAVLTPVTSIRISYLHNRNNILLVTMWNDGEAVLFIFPLLFTRSLLFREGDWSSAPTDVRLLFRCIKVTATGCSVRRMSGATQRDKGNRGNIFRFMQLPKLIIISPPSSTSLNFKYITTLSARNIADFGYTQQKNLPPKYLFILSRRLYLVWASRHENQNFYSNGNK